MAQPDPALVQWQGVLRAELAARQFIGPRLETFRPHITLARDADKPRHAVVAMPIAWQANRVALVQSEGGNGNPTVYRILAGSARAAEA
jgi:2'-5' RNA ligase